MSIGKDENNQVHKSDTMFNEDIVRTIGVAKNANSVSECINNLKLGVTLPELRNENYYRRLKDRKKWTESEIGVSGAGTKVNDMNDMGER